MKKLFALALALVTVVAIPGMAAAQTTVKIAIPSTTGLLSAGSHIVITGLPLPSVSFSSACMKDEGFDSGHPQYQAVILDPGIAAVEIAGNTATNVLVPPGTRLLNLVLEATCSDGGTTYRVYSGVVANPTQLGIALVIAPSGVTLLPGDEAVVKSDEDGTGVADVVCVQPGSPALHTELWSDIPLLRGDRLGDFQFLFYDAATGETYYDAYLEY